MERQKKILKEQLEHAKRMLFLASEIRQIKALQHRIQYLQRKLKELEKD